MPLVGVRRTFIRRFGVSSQAAFSVAGCCLEFAPSLHCPPEEPSMIDTASTRIAALAFSSLFTALMLVGMDHLATSQPPAGLVAQMTPQAASAPANT